MKVHLVDGTYELFRSHFGAPSARAPDGREVGATRGFLRSMLALLGPPDVTHVACAFDHVVESYRNDLFDGYKTGEGIEPAILAQFPLVERAASALGMVAWPMVEFEADDALATAAARYAADARVEQVVICSPDKDLGQCVRGSRVVQLDRKAKKEMDEDGVEARMGVRPPSIPDYLALVGDPQDGIPGVQRWGAKSTSAVLQRYLHLEQIPASAEDWDVKVRGAKALAENLAAAREDAGLYKTLATLRVDAPITEQLEDLEWRGAHRSELQGLCDEIGDRSFLDRPIRFREGP